MVAIVSLLVAMASVRIPWTVFAFLGGALAIGVGFGAQTLINNFISGVILLCERSIRVGDIVEVDDQRGKVMRVSSATITSPMTTSIPRELFQLARHWTSCSLTNARM